MHQTSMQSTIAPNTRGGLITADNPRIANSNTPISTPFNNIGDRGDRTFASGTTWLPSISKMIEGRHIGYYKEAVATPFKILRTKPSDCSSRYSSSITTRGRGSSHELHQPRTANKKTKQSIQDVEKDILVQQ